MHVYFHHIDLSASDALLEALKNQASAQRLKRAIRYRQRDDQVRCLYAEYVLKDTLKQANRGDAYQHIHINPLGKPILDPSFNMHFNLSHSGNWVACAIDDQPIGVDVERYRERLNFNVITLFSPSEQAYIKGELSETLETEKLTRFHQLWTLKESYLKAVGTGLRTPLNTFSINIINEHQAQLVIDGKLQPQWFFYYFELDNSKPERTHFAAICAQKPIQRHHIETIKLDISSNF